MQYCSTNSLQLKEELLLEQLLVDGMCICIITVGMGICVACAK